MPEKISRDICLIKYRKFPLRAFEGDDEIFFYPKTYFRSWYQLEHQSNAGLAKALATELPKLCRNLNIENLIFLSDYNQNWISKSTEERKDSKSLSNAIDYFKKNKIAKNFNGGLKVNRTELEEFITHFYSMTVSDGGFCYYHFLDEKENLLGFIHYSGDVQFYVLNNKTEKTFIEQINKTKFQPKV